MVKEMESANGGVSQSTLPSAPENSRTWQQVLGNVVPQHLEAWILSLTGSQQILVLIGVVLFSFPLITTPANTWQTQAIIGGLIFFVATRIGHIPQLRGVLLLMSLLTTSRYLYYRVLNTLNFAGFLDGLATILLFSAELYAILVLFIGYFQTISPTNRKPAPLPPLEQLPHVDIYIPTYNEDVEIVRKTALGAKHIDYPKKTVYILDDGRPGRRNPPRQGDKDRRLNMWRMAEEIGIKVLTRKDNDHAKAGNINTAMKRTGGDLILILDCDHIPTRDILRNVVGFFVDEKVALVQTPHWFYNPDPFERNLMSIGKVPTENDLFYRVIQRGNDFWNAAFFCGSAAIVRKKYLLQVGGIATETITEDCHTSFRLHSLGYKTIYFPKIMVAGLAPEMYSSYVVQRTRWAQGMVQILRIENSLFKKGLDTAQRICYFGAQVHFLFGIPRLIYAMAPVLFLLLNINPIRGLGLETAAYALPHIMLSTYANFISYKETRFSFWSEVYEFAMSYYAGSATLTALINPRAGKFNVTDKGMTVEKKRFDWAAARPMLICSGLVLISLIIAPIRLWFTPSIWQAVLINYCWGLYNLALMSGAVAVALEQPQRRRTHRVDRQLRAIIHANGRSWEGRTQNISESGVFILLDSWPLLPSTVELEIFGDTDAHVRLAAKLIRGIPQNERQMGFAFDFSETITKDQFDNLVLVIYNDVNEWYSVNSPFEDDPGQSFMFILTSIWRTVSTPLAGRAQVIRKQAEQPIRIYASGHYFNGTLTALGADGFTSTVTPAVANALEHIRTVEVPLVGIEMPTVNGTHRLIAKLNPITPISGDPVQSVTIEALFPTQMEKQQLPKVLAAVADLN
ncbi:MAG: hypothetical protein OHK0012_03120 [Synechococcales cyanobacterium]